MSNADGVRDQTCDFNCSGLSTSVVRSTSQADSWFLEILPLHSTFATARNRFQTLCALVMWARKPTRKVAITIR